MSLVLSICIPTFNRPAYLKTVVALFLAQWQDGVELVILDNCSAVAAEEVLAETTKGHPARANIRIIRNAVNIGAGANLLRCFEVAQGAYVWVFGDDDTPTANALQTVLSVLSLHPKAIYANFASTISEKRAKRRDGMIKGRGLVQFIEAMDCFGHFLFISSSVYKSEAIRNYLRDGYYSTHTMAPHLVMLFHMVAESDEDWLVSEKRIVDWVCPPPEQRWNANSVYLNLWNLLDVLPVGADVAALAEMKQDHPVPNTIPFRAQLLKSISGEISDVERLELLKFAKCAYYCRRVLYYKAVVVLLVADLFDLWRRLCRFGMKTRDRGFARHRPCVALERHHGKITGDSRI